MVETKMPDYPKGATFEQVWAALMEIAERQKETDRKFQEAAERQMKEVAERQKETDRKFQEAAERQMKEVAERQKEAAERQKEAAERQKEAAERQKEADRKFQEAAERQMKEAAERQKEAAERRREIDLQIKETNRQISKLGGRFGEVIEYMVMPNLLGKFRELGFVFSKAYPHAILEDENRNFITEINITLENGDKVMINENEKLFALKTGFYVIQPSGDTFNITAPEGCYIVKEW